MFDILFNLPESPIKLVTRPGPPGAPGWAREGGLQPSEHNEAHYARSVSSQLSPGEIIRITHSSDKMPDNAAWEICTALCGPEKLIQVCFRKILISYQPRMAITFRLKLLKDSFGVKFLSNKISISLSFFSSIENRLSCAVELYCYKK